MGISGWIKVKCRDCGKTTDWYLENLPSSNSELIYTCDECIEKDKYLSSDPTYG